VTVTLRAATDADTETLYAFQAEPEGSAMAVFASRDPEAFEAHQVKVLADSTNVFRVIEADGVVVGSIGSWNAGDDRAVGFWLGRDHWGRGYATEALRAFLQVDRARPLTAYVAVQNVASRRVLEKAGFSVVERRLADGGIEEDVLRRTAP
jgi:RimJ/RimL family protein N-acetyltransferase